MNEKVRNTVELQRILQLPRRRIEDAPKDLPQRLTALLRKPEGSQSLRDLQALALYEMHYAGGAFCAVEVGGGKCGRADVEVYDPARGRRLISEHGSLRVLSQKDGKLVFADALAFASGQKPCRELALRDGSRVGLSDDHPVLTHRGWVECALVKSTDLVAIPRKTPAPERPLEITDREVILCAYLLADGGLSQAQATWTNARPECQREFETLWPDFRVEQGRGCLTYHLHGATDFRKKWELFGLSKTKRVHSSFWTLSDRHVALFLHRFFSCDGYYEAGRSIATTLASEKLVDDLKFLLSRLGIHARKGFKKAKLREKSFDAWRLTIRGADAVAFLSCVGELFGRDATSLRKLFVENRNTNTDVVPISTEESGEIADELGVPRMLVRTKLSATKGQWVSRDLFERAAKDLGYAGRHAWLATSDLRWERVKSNTPLPIQDVYDLSVPGFGCFVGDGVVVHNTLTSLLAPYIFDAKRPLLIVPASLRKKTEDDRKKYAAHWRIPNNIMIESYELLGRVQRASFLEEYKPDLLIFDEVHRLKNRRAAVTRRIARYMHDHPEVRVVALSGTVMKRSLLDFGHILRWCLKENAPVPATVAELEEWAWALDEKVDEFERYEPGALLQLCPGGSTREDARNGFRKRLTETPGVVATVGEGERVDCSIYIRAVRYKVQPITDQHFEKLRKRMLTPDDWELTQAVDVWRHARELAIGLHYVWSPRPPQEWRNARRDWGCFVREVLSRSRTLDSELQVANAIDAGKLDDDGVLERWRAQKVKLYDGKPFIPNVEARWHDDSALNVCLEWMREPGIVWTEHELFARRLAEASGAKYYGAKGLASDGEFIDHADGRRAIIASADANREGRNLQEKWGRGLVTCPQEGPDWWQQLIGRFHRPGQTRDEVQIDVLLGCKEHANAWRRALDGAQAIKDTTGADSKLLIADIDWPSDSEIDNFDGARWGVAA